jgi:NADH-quinone oxidoreductase subunit F
VDAAGERRGGAVVTITDAPRLITARFQYDDSHTLTRYEATGGYEGLRAALAKSPSQVVEEVKTASLLGRGGAGFPAGVKWGFCPPGAWPRYLVVNGDESEPGTYKDRMLMERDPHQLIEGMLITAYAVGCTQAFLYVRGEMALAQERLALALNDAYEAGYVGRNILGSELSVDVVLHWGAGAYIVGEETALIESLEGNRGMPRLKPPFFPAAKGLYMQPTIVNNVETLSNVPWIVKNGGDAFAALGAESSKGTRMFAVSGHVKKPGVFEVEFGVTTFRDIIFAPVYAGGIRSDRSLKAFIPGGASAPWFFDEHLDLPLEKTAVDKAGSMLGSGAIVVMDDTTDIVRACHRVVRFFAEETCGKCTPCREGTPWLEKILKRILDGYGRPSDLDLLLDVSDNISPGIAWPPKQTTICPLGPSAVSPIASALRRFRGEFDRYIEQSPFGSTEPGAGSRPAAATPVELRIGGGDV